MYVDHAGPGSHTNFSFLPWPMAQQWPGSVISTRGRERAGPSGLGTGELVLSLLAASVGELPPPPTTSPNGVGKGELAQIFDGPGRIAPHFAMGDLVPPLT